MEKQFPGTDLKGNPHTINCKITIWKKNYDSLTSMLSRSGVGFNLKGNHTIDCENEQWEQIVKADSNARHMRYESWPYLKDWKEIFGKDRATGDNAEDVMDVVNEMLHKENLAETCAPEDSINQSPQGDQLQGVCDLQGQMHQDTSARLENLASRISYEYNLGIARKQVFNMLGNINELSLDDKFDICEILADKVERLEIFMGLPDDARPQYVMRLLKSKGT